MEETNTGKHPFHVTMVLGYFLFEQSLRTYLERSGRSDDTTLLLYGNPPANHLFLDRSIDESSNEEENTNNTPIVFRTTQHDANRYTRASTESVTVQ